MQIQINNLVPIPLKDKFSGRQSDIWNKQQTFNSGEWIKIKAPSGTGKTTFAHILYKLRTDYHGSVQWNLQDLSQLNKEELAHLRQTKVSIIFQDLRLFENLTARENIELKRIITRPVYDSNVINEMAERLGILHILHQPAGICSYGEQQRIAIIRSLVQPYEWLVMDEPFSNLDNDNTLKAAQLIAEECTKRKAGFILLDLDEDSHFNYTKKFTL